MKKYYKEYLIKIGECVYLEARIKRALFSKNSYVECRKFHSNTYSEKCSIGKFEKWGSDKFAEISESLKGSGLKESQNAITDIFNTMSVLNGFTWYYV